VLSRSVSLKSLSSVAGHCRKRKAETIVCSERKDGAVSVLTGKTYRLSFALEPTPTFVAPCLTQNPPPRCVDLIRVFSYRRCRPPRPRRPLFDARRGIASLFFRCSTPCDGGRCRAFSLRARPTRRLLQTATSLAHNFRDQRSRVRLDRTGSRGALGVRVSLTMTWPTTRTIPLARWVTPPRLPCSFAATSDSANPLSRE